MSNSSQNAQSQWIVWCTADELRYINSLSLENLMNYVFALRLRSYWDPGMNVEKIKRAAVERLVNMPGFRMPALPAITGAVRPSLKLTVTTEVGVIVKKVRSAFTQSYLNAAQQMSKL